MKEKFKTFILIILVCISIFLTKQLWIEVPTKVFSSLNKPAESFSSSYLLIDMIAPNKYLLNFDAEKHMLFYDESIYELWTDARSSLNQILESKDVEIEIVTGDDVYDYNAKKSISFSFPEKLNTYILAKALDVETPNKITDTIKEVNSIYIYLGSKEPFFVFSNDKEHVRVEDVNIDIEKIKEQFLEIEEKEQSKENPNYYYSMRQTMGTDKDIYIPYPYEVDDSFPRVFVENEIESLNEEDKRKLAERFFDKNIDYIREIVESNGSYIYIDDQRILKLNVNGSLEYFHGIPDQIVSKKRNLYESMNTAADFISKNIGLPKGMMHLADVEDIEEDGNLGYRFNFKYRIKGIPVILGNKEVVDFIEVEVYNDHIESYKQFIRRDMNKSENLLENDEILNDRKMFTSFEVIDMNYDIFLDEYISQDEDMVLKEITTEEILSIIEDINLAYFDPCFQDTGDELIGIWAIRTKKYLYGFDVYNGKLVYSSNNR